MAPTPMIQALDLLEATWRRTAVLNRKMLCLAHSNLRFGFELARAKTLSDVLSLQADYWQNQWSAFQAEDVGNEFSKAVEPRRVESVKPQRAEAVEPLSPGQEPVRPQAETPQAEAKAVESPVVVDAPQKVMAGAPGKPKQDSAHKPARKTAAPAPQAERKSAKSRPKPAHDRPSEARAPERKGRARGPGAVSPTSTDKIQFGMLDGNAVRFTSREAWALLDGAWKRIPVDEVLSDAAVLSQARFDQRYPKVPPLPASAFQPKGKQKQ